MSCLVYGGDPPLCEGCIGSKFAHPPGMLCREQRTALTTRVRCETKRDMGQVTMRLQDLSSLMDLRQKVTDDICKSPSPCCDRTSHFSYSSHLCLESLSGHSCASSSVISDNLVDNNCNELGNAVNLPSDVDRKCRAASSRRRRNYRLIIPKLSKVFIWCSLLCLMYPVCTKGSPITKRSSSKKMSQVPLWINPCGVGSTDDTLPEGVVLPTVSDRELLSQIVTQAKIAFDDASKRKEDFIDELVDCYERVRVKFGVDFDQHRRTWEPTKFNWLPANIPKELGAQVSRDHLESLKSKVDDTLVTVYEALQILAVGLEQVTSDAKATNSPFKLFFANTEDNLRAVLCEIQVAIIERGATSRSDVKRDIMSAEIRNEQGADRCIRDWVILRDYLNTLEYIKEVFDYLKDHVNS